MSIWRWADWFDSVPPESRITLGEGNTPLVRSRQIGPREGLKNLYFKVDSANPSGSYKDRFAAAAISHMVSEKRFECVACSSGNTGSALAAYCAAVPDMVCRLGILESAPEGKLRQMRAYGADVFRVRGFGSEIQVTDQVMEGLLRMGDRPGAEFQISAYFLSPRGMSGVQTISYELAEQLDCTIDHVFCPSGGGGLTLAVARGFALLVDQGKLARSPKIECVQPEGNDTMASPLRDGKDEPHPCKCTSQISGLQVETVNDGPMTIPACRASGGTGHLATDEAAWELQKRLASEEGIFCEPAGAVALAGALQAKKGGLVDPDACIVCLVTGSGFKDDAALDRAVSDQPSRMLELNEFLKMSQR